ncbi:SDR family NAD(P)-dependent oxidoreductase [Streptomyces sp. NPDC004012]
MARTAKSARDGPTRSPERAEEFRRLLGEAATDRLHLVVHDYTSFAGAERLAAEMEARLGGIDHVVAPIGGWWAGRRLWEIDEADWADAFIGLATAHMAVARAVLPRLNPRGSHTLVLGASVVTPVPGSGLDSMEQAALLMMRQVLEAELDGAKRMFALILGPVRTRLTDSAAPDWISADQVGAVAVATSATASQGSREIHLRTRAEADAVLAALRAGRAAQADGVVAVSILEPKPGQRDGLLALLAELASQIRAEPGCFTTPSTARRTKPTHGCWSCRRSTRPRRSGGTARAWPSRSPEWAPCSPRPWRLPPCSSPSRRSTVSMASPGASTAPSWCPPDVRSGGAGGGRSVPCRTDDAVRQRALMRIDGDEGELVRLAPSPCST